MDDIEDEIMDFSSNEEEELEQYRRKRIQKIRIVALIVAIAFFFMAMDTTLQLLNLPSLGFLKISQKLKEEPSVKESRKAVVLIKAQDRQGTGFNIDPNGLIITNAHVVEEAPHVDIQFSSGKRYSGTIQGIYPEIDLAIIHIKGKNLPTLKLEENQERKKGEEVLIIGNPLGFPGVATKGAVEGMARLKDWEDPVLVLKGTIHHGSSGSPVMDQNHKVIGVVFGTIEQDENEEEIIGVAIPVERIKEKLGGT